MSLVSQLHFDRDGLIPAIITDARTGQVLSVLYMNAEAVETTVETGLVHYWSRSRRKLRKKGKTSGGVQRVREVRLECEGGSLLVAVEAEGDACRKGHRSCFHRVWEAGGLRTSDLGAPLPGAKDDILAAVYQVIQSRREAGAETSYVASLFHKGLDKVLAKVGEEATETAVAGKGGEPEEVVYEAADLFFHTLVLLAYYDLPPERIYDELRRRFGLSGLAEKASRGQ